jgi:hypothetical protein
MTHFGFAKKFNGLLVLASLSFAALFGSCENPFSSSMGGKVNITPPEISISTPRPGEYIKATTAFSGSASDDRKVVKVEVKVYPSEDGLEPGFDWTPDGVVMNGGDKEKTWSYDFDTIARNSGTDGMIKMQFRVWDEGKTPTFSPEMVYIIKNLPPVIKITAPQIANPNVPAPSPYTLVTGDELRGQISDRRGIKPGYPLIKLWPDTLPAEPADNDPNWGFFSAFIAGQDDTAAWTYNTNKWNEPVKQAAQFAIPLKKYSITHNAANDTHVMVLDPSDDPLPLTTGYYFRIKASDVFFDSQNKHPRPPVLANGEVEALGYYPALITDSSVNPPKEDPFSEGAPVHLTLTSAEVRPSISFDNTDAAIDDTAFDALSKPHKYINSPSSRKLTAAAVNKDVFRLRILTTHPDGVEKAVIRWSHSGTNRSGSLIWDDIGSNGYVNNTNNASKGTDGHYGEDVTLPAGGSGRRFQFTAKSGLKTDGTIAAALPDAGDIFTSSTSPYTITVIVTSITQVEKEQNYTLYIDGTGPQISIREDIFKGASQIPANPAGSSSPGGSITTDSYTVYGNIEVSLTAIDDSGLLTTNHKGSSSYPMIKWVLLQNQPGSPGIDALYNAIQAYRSDPIGTGTSFFDTIAAPNETLESGWVRPGDISYFQANTKAGGKSGDWWLYIIAMDRVYNVGYKIQKLNILQGADQPGIDFPGLLGSGETPADGTGSIASGNDLNVTVNDNKTNVAGSHLFDSNGVKKNVLVTDQGIELNFADDDGIALSGITLTISDSRGTTVTLTESQLKAIPLSGNPVVLNGNPVTDTSKQWTGVLSQGKMLEFLKTAPSSPYTAASILPDGIYSLTVTVADDPSLKVSISREPGDATDPSDNPVLAVTPAETFYFAVNTSEPEINVLVPLEDNQMMTQGAVTINGTVKSALEVQKLWISFNPAQTGSTATPTPGTLGKIPLYADSAYTDTTLANAVRDANGLFTYYWRLGGVDFGNVPGSYIASERYFTLEAADRLGNIRSLTRAVLIDSTPPEVALVNFEKPLDFGNPVVPNTVNGKITFRITGSDEFGMASWAAGDPNGGGKAPVRWWLLPSSGTYTLEWDFAAPTFPASNGAGGWFTETDFQNNGYETSFNTNTVATPDGEYYLFGISLDMAQNPSHPKVEWQGKLAAAPGGAQNGWAYYDTALSKYRIYHPSAWQDVANPAVELGLLQVVNINQPSDMPIVEYANPSNNEVKSLSGTIISGRVYDDDGFDNTKLNTYAKIRFPTGWNNTGSIVADITAWTPWYPLNGTADGQDSITFSYNLSSNLASLPAGTQTYFATTFDGPKVYQIQVTDDAVRKGDTAKTAEQSFVFIFDNNKPKIFFSNYDPDSTHDGTAPYTTVYYGKPVPGRPTFQLASQITAVLSGFLDEPNLRELSYQYNGEDFKVITTANTSLDPGMNHSWTIPANAFDAGTAAEPFSQLVQGPHPLALRAVDLAGNTTTVYWNYTKDTQGPGASFANIGRAVNHTFTPAESVFDTDPNAPNPSPLNPAWPSDWPDGTAWNGAGSNWASEGFTAATTQTWPSELVFMGKAAAKLLADEKARYSGGAGGGISVVSAAQGAAAISGTFDDVYSNLINSNTDVVQIAYRFDTATGRQDTTTPWLQAQLQGTATGSAALLPQKNAKWNIVLPDQYPGATPFVDGQHTLDIKAWDKAGNETQIFGLAFYVDREDPVITLTSVTPGNGPSERQVFSAADAVSGDGATVFTLGGNATDNNLKGVALYLPGETSPASDVSAVLPSVPWSISITKGMLYALRDKNAGITDNDAYAHTVTVVASDRAERVTSVDFSFYLDSAMPEIKYDNLAPGSAGTSFDTIDVALRGQASDANQIRDIKFNLARWNYSTNVWNYWNGTDWTSTTRPALGVAAAWPTIGMSNYQQGSGNWTIDLKNYNGSNGYANIAGLVENVGGVDRPADGKYLLSLSVTDWSYSDTNPGNPHTTDDANANFNDTGNPSNVMSSRVFYIDRTAPIITWNAPHDRQTYYRPLDGNNRVDFNVTASDGNTIKEVRAKVSANDNPGAYLAVWGQYGVAGTEHTFVTGGTISPVTQNIQVRMPAGSVEKLYLLTLTVIDGAGNEATQNYTKQFFYDHTKPVLSINDPAPGGTVTGQVQIRGGTTEANGIRRVAYKVVTSDAPTLNDAFYADAAGNYNGWVWLDVSSDPYYPPAVNNGEIRSAKTGMTGTTLMKINDGSFTWTVDLPDSGDLDLDYIAPTSGSTWVTLGKAGASGYPALFGSTTIPNDAGYPSPNVLAKDRVYKLRLYFKAEDQAGNVGYLTGSSANAKLDVYIYPEGDRPVITGISNPDMTLIEAQRLMNGRVRIYGTARDNDRVASVWFRVLDTENKMTASHVAGTNAMTLVIPNWNTTDWSEAAGTQTPQTIDGAGGWYLANGGGSANVNWWANINANGELDPPDGRLPVEIQVRAFDTYRDPSGIPYPTVNTPVTTPTTGNGNRKLGPSLAAKAFFEAGAPILDDEQIKQGASGFNVLLTDPAWTPIAQAHMSKAASYRITVKDDTGIAAIRWQDAPGGAIANLLDVDAAKFTGDYSAAHIAARAQPNPAYFTTSLTAGNIYMIWDAAGTGLLVSNASVLTADGGQQLTAPDNVRYTLVKVVSPITVAANSVLQQAPVSADGRRYFEWIVTVDVETEALGYANAANPHRITLAAQDTSKPLPLTTTRVIDLPIDNLPPDGHYTGNSKSAGINYTVQGEATDGGSIYGLKKVILWFEQMDGTRYPYRRYNLNASGLVDTTSTNAYTGGTPLNNVKVPAGYPGAVGGFATVTLPAMDGKSGIVIDQDDPYGRNNNHEGLDGSGSLPGSGWNGGAAAARDNAIVPMGFTNAGAIATWYADINSTRMESGPYILNYIVVDTAGNATLLRQKLIIRNNAPQIASIRLATDIRSDRSATSPVINLQDMTAAGATGTTNLAAKTGLLDYIRTAYNSGVYAGKTDPQKGITQPITVTYGSTTAKSVADFNARNGLFAVEINALAAPGAGKTRTFRLEYVNGQTAGVAPASIKRGRVYVIQSINAASPTNFGAVGAPDNFAIGTPFLATEDGAGILTGADTVTELNTSYYNGSNVYVPPTGALALPDTAYITTGDPTAVKAEFVYKAAAFGTAAGTIHDGKPAVTAADTLDAGAARFILKIFDGPETDDFADFALLSIRVNNNDITPPTASLYDLNPKTEGAENGQAQAVSLTPPAIGQNRLLGGLWNTDPTANTLKKPGHIEPRATTSFTSAEMGGAFNAASGTVSQPYADPATFFTVDTVSGRVVLRGYSFDDQRIDRIAVKFGTDTEIVILETAQAAETVISSPQSVKTGLLAVPTAQAGNVFFSDTLDLYGHKVEWAYVWNTETNPAAAVVGNNITVRAIAYNRKAVAYPTTDAEKQSGSVAAGTTTAGTQKDYNTIGVNLRPYITGFARNTVLFYHDTRSLQGWYSFARGEAVTVQGFNLKASGNTYVNMPGMAQQTITAAPFTFTIPEGGTARSGRIDLEASVGATRYGAVNTFRVDGATPVYRTLNRPNPWNMEASSVAGSDLWDDYTSAHIWQSNDTVDDTTGAGALANRGRFNAVAATNLIENPAMTIDPTTGRLWNSYNHNGNGNTGRVYRGSNSSTDWTPSERERFIDPIIHSDIFFSTTAAGAAGSPWTAFSVIGRNGTDTGWGNVGGVYVDGPGGGTSGNNSASGTTVYLVEKAWYDEDITTDQFMNPHVVTFPDGTSQRIHVAYHDSVTGSIRYRYNYQGSPGTINANTARRGWVNLDGGISNRASAPLRPNTAKNNKDTQAVDAANPYLAVAANGRILGGTGRPTPTVGLHNAIDVTSQGYPVIAYFDQTNQKLKLAYSNNNAPQAAANWAIQDVFPAGDANERMTGEYVSIRIDRRGNGSNSALDQIHIAASRSDTRDLVYITGTQAVAGGPYIFTTSQTVDSTGVVGRWSDISLDADGNPWITYQDESRRGSMDGVKTAFRDRSAAGVNYFTKDSVDENGIDITGWEALSVPARYRVEDARISIENFPTRNIAPTGGSTQFWQAAVGYLSVDYFRIAYYIKRQ